jgi:hypothetical protein
MKISKTHLRQVIKEELESYFAKPQNLNEDNFGDFLNAIAAGEVDMDLLESEEPLEEISMNPGSSSGPAVAYVTVEEGGASGTGTAYNEEDEIIGKFEYTANLIDASPMPGVFVEDIEINYTSGPHKGEEVNITGEALEDLQQAIVDTEEPFAYEDYEDLRDSYDKLEEGASELRKFGKDKIAQIRAMGKEKGKSKVDIEYHVDMVKGIVDSGVEYDRPIDYVARVVNDKMPEWAMKGKPTAEHGPEKTGPIDEVALEEAIAEVLSELMS